MDGAMKGHAIPATPCAGKNSGGTVHFARAHFRGTDAVYDKGDAAAILRHGLQVMHGLRRHY
jgi:hypothetical protein